MREILYPAIYRHFKNKFYATMAISHPAVRSFITAIVEKECEMYNAIDTETKEVIHIYKFANEYYHNDSRKCSYVLYKSLYDDTGIYARELEIFESEVDKEKYPDTFQRYRFELNKNLVRYEY